MNCRRGVGMDFRFGKKAVPGVYRFPSIHNHFFINDANRFSISLKSFI